MNSIKKDKQATSIDKKEKETLINYVWRTNPKGVDTLTPSEILEIVSNYLELKQND